MHILAHWCLAFITVHVDLMHFATLYSCTQSDYLRSICSIFPRSAVWPWVTSSREQKAAVQWKNVTHAHSVTLIRYPFFTDSGKKSQQKPTFILARTRSFVVKKVTPFFRFQGAHIDSHHFKQFVMTFTEVGSHSLTLYEVLSFALALKYPHTLYYPVGVRN